MVTYAEEDYLQLSGIQHFAFCRRQWALMVIETVWAENVRTVEGYLMHEHAHDPFFTEKRGDMLVTREMPVFSRSMGVSGKCDVVEFLRDGGGVTLFGREGLWLPRPVEYKRGAPKAATDADRLQLCAQAMCIEEMLLCPRIDVAHLYYGETKRREHVPLTDELRETVRGMYQEMHKHYERRYTPRVKSGKSCKACSLKDVCLPDLPSGKASVHEYLDRQLEDPTR
ncbi:MAG: CRISPR-associated protein Cas4 [Clostridiales bacterium]|jgi:CRISPR-associated exonuclease Cas4|nr:CRISPR-associated protein Cas4 [Clostridiales bacterium]